jgi:hypothetical protein
MLGMPPALPTGTAGWGAGLAFGIRCCVQANVKCLERGLLG